MDQQTKDNAENAANQIALMELLRLVLSEMLYHEDPQEFRRRVSLFETAAVNGITARTHFPQAPAAVEAHVKETASAMTTKILTSIRHPSERP